MRHSPRQKGQVLPITLAGIVIAAMLMFLMSNVGNRVTEKSMVSNAADAAAYSGATFIAQHLNFMAYTNRAMIANHIGVGHFVAYMSWTRYIEEVAENIDTIAQFIPYVNVVSEIIEEVATLFRELAEIAGAIYVPAVDTINLFYAAAQAEAHASISFGNANTIGGGGAGGPGSSTLERVMQAAAVRFDPSMKINDADAIASLGANGSAEVFAALAFQFVNIPQFIEPLEVTERDGEFTTLVERTYGIGPSFFATGFVPVGEMSDEWLNDRGWTFLTVEKEYETDHTLDDNLAKWETSDSLVNTSLTGKKETFASGEATAEEFDSSYKGITRYYNLAEKEVDHHTLPVMAYASKDQSRVSSHDVLGLSTPDTALSALSIAHVLHKRPSVGFLPLQSFGFGGPRGITAGSEYANLYNPFWKARIVGTRYADLPKAAPGVVKVRRSP